LPSTGPPRLARPASIKAEPLPGLRGGLLVGGGAGVLRPPPPHAGLREDAAGGNRVIVGGFGVRDKHEEGTRPFSVSLSSTTMPPRREAAHCGQERVK
jgi:hypothetical protein